NMQDIGKRITGEIPTYSKFSKVDLSTTGGSIQVGNVYVPAGTLSLRAPTGNINVGDILTAGFYDIPNRTSYAGGDVSLSSGAGIQTGKIETFGASGFYENPTFVGGVGNVMNPTIGVGGTPTYAADLIDTGPGKTGGNLTVVTTVGDITVSGYIN